MSDFSGCRGVDEARSVAIKKCQIRLNLPLKAVESSGSDVWRGGFGGVSGL